MNPKITITIDAKNKAVASVEGMLTVGAKVDLAVTGLPSGIPDWESTDAFSGASLRFRLVDEMGHDLALFPRVSTDAWTKTAATGTTPETYSATNVELDTAPLRMRFDCVPFNERIELGMIFDSVVDDAQYAIGKVKVSQWAMASTEDPKVLPDWRETLVKLKTDLASVEASKTAAEAAATAAGGSSSSASASASAAAASAASASASASRADETTLHYPRVGTNGNWELWNVAQGKFVDSGRSAVGMSSYFYDPTDRLYHLVQIAKNERNEYVVSVAQDGTATPTETYAKDTAVVHLSGDETVRGVKTFTSDFVHSRVGASAYQKAVFANLDIAEKPAASTYHQLAIQDKNGTNVVRIIESVEKSDGSRNIVLRANDESGNDINIASFKASFDGSSATARGAALAAVGFPSSTQVQTVKPASWPSATKGYLDFGTSESPIETAPCNGWLLVSMTLASGEYLIAKTGFAKTASGEISNTIGLAKTSDGVINIPVTKGMYVQFEFNTGEKKPTLLKFTKAMAEV